MRPSNLRMAFSGPSAIKFARILSSLMARWIGAGPSGSSPSSIMALANSSDLIMQGTWRSPLRFFASVNSINLLAAPASRRDFASLLAPILHFHLAALLLVAAGCTRQAPASAKDRRAEPTPVSIAIITNAAWDKTVSIIGTLYPKDEATLGDQVEGTVEQTLVDFGDRVLTNQVL